MADLNLEAERALFDQAFLKTDRRADAGVLALSWHGLPGKMWRAARSAVPAQAGAAEVPEGWMLVPKSFVSDVRRVADIADSYSPSIDSIDEHGGEECEEPIWQIHHILYYAHAKLLGKRAAAQQPAQGEHSAGAADAMTDSEIEALFTAHMGRWDGDHWVIEDADLHPFVRSVAAQTQAQGEHSAGVGDAERKAFEHAERASNLQRDEIGDYANPCVQSAWEGWQARAALATASAASAPDAQSERDALLDEVASIVTMYDKRATPQGIAAAIRSMKSVAAAHKAQRERGPT